MLWVASQTNIPAAIVKPIMLLPTCSVKACAKYQLLEESDEQYRSLCVQKPETAGLYLLHVTGNSTKPPLEHFNWSSLLILQKWKVELLTFLISRPLWVYCCTRDGRWKSSTSRVYDEPCLKTYEYHPWHWTLHWQRKYHFSNYKQFLKQVVSDWKKRHFYFISPVSEAMIWFKPWNIISLKTADGNLPYLFFWVQVMFWKCWKI